MHTQKHANGFIQKPFPSCFKTSQSEKAVSIPLEGTPEHELGSKGHPPPPPKIMQILFLGHPSHKHLK